MGYSGDKNEKIEKGGEMKNSIVFLLLILMVSTSFLFAENDEWGAWFKESIEMSKENPIIPEDRSINLKRWKDGKSWLIENYKKYLERDDNRDKKQMTDMERRNEIISSYYYDGSDPEIDEIVDFFIYVFNNDDVMRFKMEAIDNITTIALGGNNSARDFIFSQVNNTTLSHRMNLQFHLANITIREDQQSLDYLMSLIIKAQDVETTNLKYSSPDEGAIAGYLNRRFFSRRYSKGLDYDYALPLLKQMIYSRSKGSQGTAAFRYYYQTNKTEMRKIYDVCWAKVQDKTTPREEYIDALYGLQALYSLSQRNFSKHKIGFKGISSYFARLGGRKPVKNGFEYIELTDENRILKEEKQYFQQRLGSK
jgi:hypothetical protein